MVMGLVNGEFITQLQNVFNLVFVKILRTKQKRNFLKKLDMILINGDLKQEFYLKQKRRK